MTENGVRKFFAALSIIFAIQKIAETTSKRPKNGGVEFTVSKLGVYPT